MKKNGFEENKLMMELKYWSLRPKSYVRFYC